MTIDEAIESLRAQLIDIEGEIVERRTLAEGIKGEIRGLEHARDLFADAATVPPRLDIQRPIMALFPGLGAWTEDGIVRETDLPRLAVRKYLFRAVRDGKLVLTDEGYRLPSAKYSSQAAE